MILVAKTLPTYPMGLKPTGQEFLHYISGNGMVLKFTDYCDKNGKEIFEQDILESNDRWVCITYSTRQMRWELFPSVETQSISEFITNSEKIGNLILDFSLLPLLYQSKTK